METIRLVDLSIGYARAKRHKHTVATGINVVINSGELTCLLGDNGVGKSTLLRTLAAFQLPLSGDIFINNTDIRKLSDKDLAKTIGVVLTEKPDVNNLTAAEIVGLGRSPYTGFGGKLSREDDEIVHQAMQMVDIEGIANRIIHTLSDGEKQKVMIAKALAQQTPIIILDEPTAFLDFNSRVEILRLLRRLTHDMEKTVVLSTHDISIALQLSDRILIMERAQNLFAGTPKELAAQGILSEYIEQDGIMFDKNTLTANIII